MVEAKLILLPYLLPMEKTVQAPGLPPAVEYTNAGGALIGHEGETAQISSEKLPCPMVISSPGCSRTSDPASIRRPFTLVPLVDRLSKRKRSPAAHWIQAWFRDTAASSVTRILLPSPAPIHTAGDSMAKRVPARLFRSHAVGCPAAGGLKICRTSVS